MMNMLPGYGSRNLHLRQSTEQVLKKFGEPSLRKDSGTFRQYWLYQDGGFDLIVSRRSHEILSIFIHAGSMLGADMPFGKEPAAIKTQFGNPDEEGAGFALGDELYVDGWVAYDSGLGFKFGRDGRLKTVGITSPRRRERKSVVSHRPASLNQVAALTSR